MHKYLPKTVQATYFTLNNYFIFIGLNNLRINQTVFYNYEKNRLKVKGESWCLSNVRRD